MLRWQKTIIENDYCFWLVKVSHRMLQNFQEKCIFKFVTPRSHEQGKQQKSFTGHTMITLPVYNSTKLYALSGFWWTLYINQWSVMWRVQIQAKAILLNIIISRLKVSFNRRHTTNKIWPMSTDFSRYTTEFSSAYMYKMTYWSEGKVLVAFLC